MDNNQLRKKKSIPVQHSIRLVINNKQNLFMVHLFTPQLHHKGTVGSSVDVLDLTQSYLGSSLSIIVEIPYIIS